MAERVRSGSEAGPSSAPAAAAPGVHAARMTRAQARQAAARPRTRGVEASSQGAAAEAEVHGASERGSGSSGVGAGGSGDRACGPGTQGKACEGGEGAPAGAAAPPGYSGAASAPPPAPAVLPQLRALKLFTVHPALRDGYRKRDAKGRSPLRVMLPLLQGCTQLEASQYVCSTRHDRNGYDIPTIVQLTNLEGLRYWAAGDSRTGNRLDCRQLRALSQLSSLRRLGFIDPSLPHETLPHLLCRGLTHITALSALSRLTELDAGAWWLPHENCRMLLHSLAPSQRRGALEWLEACHATQGGGRLHSSQNAPPSMSQTMINLGQPLGLVFPVPDTELDPEEILDGGLDWQWE